MKNIKIQFIEKEIAYTGSELRSHFIYDQFDLLGDALVSFCGPCEVSLEHMVDLEDVKSNSPIYSEKMLHFLGEFYDLSLAATVFLQRLLMSLILEEFHKNGFYSIFRDGDDLYEDDAKISVSIATLSPSSTLIHVGINISSKNTPVKTKSLSDFKIDPAGFSKKILGAFKKEFETSLQATCKVRAVQ